MIVFDLFVRPTFSTLHYHHQHHSLVLIITASLWPKLNLHNAMARAEGVPMILTMVMEIVLHLRTLLDTTFRMWCIWTASLNILFSGNFLSSRYHYLPNSWIINLSLCLYNRCTESWSGQLARGGFDGIFGFGPYEMSFVSQLYSAGVTGKVFTICMHSPSGGGSLAFGEAVERGLVYTPIVPSR
jgi:hypothetical protein